MRKRISKSQPAFVDPQKSSSGSAGHQRRSDTNRRLHETVGNQAVQRLMRSRSDTLRADSVSSGSALNEPSEVHEAAQRGVRGTPKPLPFLDTIQQSFGAHQLTNVKAYIGGPARESAEQMGASAYATDERIAFSGWPDLRTAAHEATHVVQQRNGVHLQAGVGQAGDAYERHADAVADAVVNGRAAEPLLQPCLGTCGTHSDAVQLQSDSDQDTAAHDQGVCDALHAALENSLQVIELYREYLAGNVAWDEMKSQIQVVGNAAQGVVGAGREQPPIVQEAIEEVESFGFEEIGHMGRLLFEGVFGSDEDFRREHVEIEIERQQHFNDVLIRYMFENNCYRAGLQEQVLSIGTRGREQTPGRSMPAIPDVKETRTALAWVSVGEEHVLVLATEVAGSGGLRFESWVDDEVKHVALARAQSRQGTIPSVPASVVSGLPSAVPESAARRD